ncbi:hypothetical protein PP635_gp43 [Arthrobacter phage Auxilium]|uniref:Uncharacterized protein n=1 Tax=Arthrobacter phage Auxilium TaxID=2419948 RepID=A0A3G2KA08_9CAUD|nr:hypothetical protein PP635_gp43 [Arthrobacter phage Auxilium]AYN55822.1 hypothetical protein PBI_AUXILIUM_43 [Arthrobacter phage Auxilium]
MTSVPNHRDELALELFIGDNGNQPREQSIVDWQWFNETVRYRGRVENYKVMADAILAAGYRRIFDRDCGLSNVTAPDDREAAEAWMRFSNIVLGDHDGIAAMKQMLTEFGYRKPCAITTFKELDALPVGSVVLSDSYRYMVHGGRWPIAFQKWDDGLWHRGARSGDTHPDNFLPVTVLHEPEASL